MKRATVNEVESLAYRVMERAMMTPVALLILVTIPFLLMGGLTLWGYSGAPGGEYGGVLLVFGMTTVSFFGPLLVLLLGVALFITGPPVMGMLVYLDAQTLESAAIDWSPDPGLFAIGTFFFPPFAFYYLYKRQEHIFDVVDTGRWSTVIAGSLGLSTLLIGTGLLLWKTTHRIGIAVLLASLGILLLSPFSYAIYRDSTYVRQNSSTWHPNPGLNLPVAFASMFLLPPTYLLFGGYYLYKRRQALRAA